MITSLPAVQANCSRVKRFIYVNARVTRYEKRTANRRHRRALNHITRQIHHNPELWYDECFNAPSLSSWDLW